jgi:1-acyl-sn-glycerol-3-phosphate acyltransferase
LTHSEFQIHNSKLRIPPYHWWRTVFYLIPAITLYTIVLGAASIVSSLFDRRGHFAHRCARAWSWLILKTTGVRVRVEGLERIVPGTTYVFVSNHQSIYDTPVIFATLPHQLRIIAKESLARFPVLGWHLARRPPVRGSAAPRSHRHSPSLAGAGGGGAVLLIYAKAHEARTDMSRGSRAAASCSRFRPGFRLSRFVIGTRESMPKGGSRPDPPTSRWSSTIRYSRWRSTRPRRGTPRRSPTASAIVAGTVHEDRLTGPDIGARVGPLRRTV